MKKEAWSLVYLVLVTGALAIPPRHHLQVDEAEGRKFNVKPNNPKKVDYMNYMAEKAANALGLSSGNSLPSSSSQQPSSSSSNNPSSSSPQSSSSVTSGSGQTSSSLVSKLAKPSQVQKSESIFSWSNILSMVLQFAYNLLNPPTAAEKNGNTPLLQGGEFSWTKVLSVVLKVALAGLGADQGIDKIDNGPASPLESMLAAGLSMLMGSRDPGEVAVMAKQAGELINIGITLLDALRTSFSQRSMQARSLGGEDRFSEAAMASLALIKGYAQTYRPVDDICRQKAVCLANQACVTDAPNMNNMYCKLASYFMAIGINKRTGTEVEYFTDAARRGRMLEDCDSMYMCNDL